MQNAGHIVIIIANVTFSAESKTVEERTARETLLQTIVGAIEAYEAGSKPGWAVLTEVVLYPEAKFQTSVKR